jgi:ribosomal protein S18 acetylase RimI-like enzyme
MGTPNHQTAALDVFRAAPDDSDVRLAALSVQERICASEDALAEAGAELLVLDVGRVIRQPGFPHVYDANLVRRACLRPEGIDQALERLAAPLREVGARHLQLTLDGADVPDSVAPLLRQRGFAHDRLLAMALGPGLIPSGERAPGIELRLLPDEAPWVEFELAMDRMNREESWYAPAVSREVVGSMRKKAELGAFQVFVAERQGRVVGTVALATHRQVASILSVGTLPEARRRGVGRTMVVAAVERARAAGAELIYLIARADDSPKDMYRKLGFHVEFGFDVWLRLPR